MPPSGEPTGSDHCLVGRSPPRFVTVTEANRGRAASALIPSSAATDRQCTQNSCRVGSPLDAESSGGSTTRSAAGPEGGGDVQCRRGSEPITRVPFRNGLVPRGSPAAVSTIWRGDDVSHRDDPGLALALASVTLLSTGRAADPPDWPNPQPARLILYALKCEVTPDGPKKADTIDLWYEIDRAKGVRVPMGKMRTGDTRFPNREVEFSNRVTIVLVEKDKPGFGLSINAVTGKDEKLGSVTIEMTPGKHKHLFTNHGAKYALYYEVVRQPVLTVQIRSA